MGDWVVERISGQHRRDRFDSGHEDLDAYLQRFARQNDRADFGRTYVALRPGELEVAGYYTLAAGSVAAVEVPAHLLKGKLPPTVPVVLLGRLAVTRECQGLGLGRFLLMDALHRALGAGEALAMSAFVVRAADEQAAAFYRRYGFHALPDDPTHLFLAMRTIRRAFRREP